MTNKIDIQNPSRRQFLRSAGLASACALLTPSLGHALLQSPGERSLSFYNLHTGESESCTFWCDGQYITEQLDNINHLLRDFRTNDVIDIDIRLIEALYQLANQFQTSKPFHIISGYRSPKTNKMLRAQGRRVAKNSYHLRGQAIDIRLPGVPLKSLHSAAKALNVGGVGYYGGSNFVHMDTGPVRYW